MNKINEAIQKLIAVSPLVQNCYAVAQNDAPKSKDLLAWLVKSDEITKAYENKGILKPYKHIVIFGDALMSAVYAVYAWYALKKSYNISPSITLLHLEEDINSRETAFCAAKIIKGLGGPLTSHDRDDNYECNNDTLLIVPQHRILLAQNRIAGTRMGTYTIPGEDVILGDRDLSIFYIDESVHILRRRKQHPECVKWWNEALKEISFGGRDEYVNEVNLEIQKLIDHHSPRIRLLYY